MKLAKAKVDSKVDKTELEKKIDNDIVFFSDYFEMLSTTDKETAEKSQKNILQSSHLIKARYIYARDLFKSLFGIMIIIFDIFFLLKFAL